MLRFDHTAYGFESFITTWVVPCGGSVGAVVGGRTTEVHTCEGLSQQRLALLAEVCRMGALGYPGACVSPAWRAGGDLGTASTVLRPRTSVYIVAQVAKNIVPFIPSSMY